MTVVSNFNKTLAFSKKMSPIWDAFYMEYFKEHGAKTGDIINIRDSTEIPRYQINGWDKLIIFEGRQPPIRIEEKSRQFDAYTNYFIKDNKYWIEVEGNVEERRAGSAITTSVAEVWAYGFANAAETELTHAILFKRKEVVGWMECNPEKPSDIKYTGGTRVGPYSGYRTKGRLIPGTVIKQSKFIPLPDKQWGLFDWPTP